MNEGFTTQVPGAVRSEFAKGRRVVVAQRQGQGTAAIFFRGIDRNGDGKITGKEHDLVYAAPAKSGSTSASKRGMNTPDGDYYVLAVETSRDRLDERARKNGWPPRAYGGYHLDLDGDGEPKTTEPKAHIALHGSHQATGPGTSNGCIRVNERTTVPWLKRAHLRGSSKQPLLSVINVNEKTMNSLTGMRAYTSSEMRTRQQDRTRKVDPRRDTPPSIELQGRATPVLDQARPVSHRTGQPSPEGAPVIRRDREGSQHRAVTGTLNPPTQRYYPPRRQGNDWYDAPMRAVGKFFSSPPSPRPSTLIEHGFTDKN